MDKEIKNKLQQIFSQYGGAELYKKENKTRFSGLIADYFSDNEPIKKLLQQAIAQNIPAKLLQIEQLDGERRKQQIQLIVQHFIHANFLHQRVEIFIEYFGKLLFSENASKEVTEKDITVEQGVFSELYAHITAFLNLTEPQINEHRFWKDHLIKIGEMNLPHNLRIISYAILGSQEHFEVILDRDLGDIVVSQKNYITNVEDNYALLSDYKIEEAFYALSNGFYLFNEKFGKVLVEIISVPQAPVCIMASLP